MMNMDDSLRNLSSGKFSTIGNRRKNGNLMPAKRKYSIEDGGNRTSGLSFPTNSGDATSACKPQNQKWREGRRIVELGTLVDSLVCETCATTLHLRDVVDETRYGLGSFLHIPCQNCLRVRKVPTGKRHSVADGESGTQRCFDINTKVAAAMLNAGIGESQLNNILAGLNMPQISHKTLKDREREIGPSFEVVAEMSCDQAVSEEFDAVKCLRNSENNVEEEVSIDGGWQKRGTGHIRNSSSGHVTIMGKNNRKCLSYGVAKKNCRRCSVKHSRKHNCRKNWSGSSKAMEQFLAVQCLQQLKRKGFDVKTIIMDDDTTTLAKARQCISTALKKCSDNNHVMKNFTSELISLKPKHKLSQMIINKLTKDFSYAIKQNSQNKQTMKDTLNTIVPHAFGEHAQCNTKWCKFESRRETYSHKSLPYGKNLVGESLRHDLNEIIAKYTTDHMLQKLSALQSSNPNENMNNLIARKAPKALHYSGSESLDFRVAAAVSQKNDGHLFMTKVNETHHLSPGKFTKKRFQKLDEVRYRRQSIDRTVQKKRRRLELKAARTHQTFFNETLEGTTYKTAVGRIVEDDLLDPTSPDLLEIPVPLIEPEEPQVAELVSNNLVFFDVESTGLASNDELLQISAKDKASGDIYNKYIFPNKRISAKITSITGLEVHGRTLYYNMEPVDAVSLPEALLHFSAWLMKFKPCILIAHNANFDARMLVNAYQSSGVGPLKESVTGFVDTLPLFKSAYPGRQTYNQESLVKDILQTDYRVHNAVDDVATLMDLYSRIPHNCLHTTKLISFEKIEFNLQRLKNEKANLPLFDEMISQKNIPKAHAIKIAGAGLSPMHLETIYVRSGQNGVQAILKALIKSKTVSSTCEKMCYLWEGRENEGILDV